MSESETLSEFAKRFWTVTKDDPDKYWEHRWAEELCNKLGVDV